MTSTLHEKTRTVEKRMKMKKMEKRGKKGPYFRIKGSFVIVQHALASINQQRRAAALLIDASAIFLHLIWAKKLPKGCCFSPNRNTICS
jgi:hypothetical protein